MDDQLDNDLKNRIKEVFDNYEDTSADEGWLQLRKRYPEKAKRIIAAWVYWAPVAALLLLFIGIVWFQTAPKKQQVAIAKVQPVHPAIKEAEGKKNGGIVRDSSVLSQNNSEIAQNAQKHGTVSGGSKDRSNPATPSGKGRQEFALNHQKNANPMTSKSPANASVANTIAQANTTAQAKIQNPDASPEKPGLTTAIAPKNQSVTTLNPNNEVIAKVDSGNKSPVKSNIGKPAPEVNVLAQQTNKNNKRSFADNNNSYEKQKSLSKGKPVSFEVYTTTYVNYAKGSNHQFNMGAGFTSDIKLTKNLLFSTGMSIGQNSLNYAGQPPVESAAASSFATPTATLSGLTASRYAFTASTAPPAFRNYSASLVGLDIPLNLKFIVDPQKSGTYLLAGVSSGTYINETYTYSYNNPSFFSANVSQIQDQSTRSSFNGFYFAKTLNLAVGTGYTIGHSRLVVEPFLKYPLEGLGSQQLRFGAGGVNLKFNFNGFKK